MRTTLCISICLLAIAVAGCSGTPIKSVQKHIDYSDITREPYSRTGNNVYTVFGVTYVPLSSPVGYREKGIASWYGKKFHGRRTSSGETYNMYAMTAAHKTLPLPTYVEVTNLKNNRKVIVKVNDRGPFIDGRIIDLSYTAAKELDLIGPGTGPVLVEAITPWITTSLSKVDYNYLISTGVFSSRDNADKLTKKLKRSGFKKAHIRSKNVSGSTMYQVLVGPYQSSEKVGYVVEDLFLHLSESPVVIRE